MNFNNDKYIKTNIDELNEKEQLMLLRGIYREITRDCFKEWLNMIKFGKGKTSECDAKWHETCQYMHIVEYCEHELEKLNNRTKDSNDR